MDMTCRPRSQPSGLSSHSSFSTGAQTHTESDPDERWHVEGESESGSVQAQVSAAMRDSSVPILFRDSMKEAARVFERVQFQPSGLWSAPTAT